MNPMTPIIWAGALLATAILLALTYAVLAGLAKAIHRQRVENEVRRAVTKHLHNDETRTG